VPIPSGPRPSRDSVINGLTQCGAPDILLLVGQGWGVVFDLARVSVRCSRSLVR
jgi:hypothetical protein